MGWQFNPPGDGELRSDPVQDEFFRDDESVTDPLVREAIQNSLDAADGDGPVDVRFALGRAGDLGRTYIDGLWPHIHASISDAPALPASEDTVTYLVIEDRGTRGLKGDPRQRGDSDSGKKNDFYYFWRNVGRSGKGETDGGRWGLGKAVFSAASRIQTFFGMTVRKGDAAALLMGQSMLRSHQLGGQTYRAYGYYGRHEGKFTLPVDTHMELDTFSRTFGLERVARNASGLSLIVPYPHTEITVDGLIASVVEQYFHSLLAGKLRVQVEGDGRCVHLNAESQSYNGALRDMIDLDAWGRAPEPDAIATLAAQEPGRAPKLTDTLFAPGDLDRLRQRYDAAQRVAIRIPVHIEPKGSAPTATHFTLLMERDPELQRGKGLFIRGHITVENARVRRPRGVRWLVVVDEDEKPLSTFLGDAENPAHTEWQRSARRLKQQYVRGPSTVDFIRSVPHQIATLLAPKAEGRDPDLLRHVFSLPDETAMSAKVRYAKTADPTGTNTTSDPEFTTLGPSGELSLTRVQSGFRLRGNAENVPRRVRVEAAYQIIRGDPFKRYSSFDFQVGARPIVVRSRHVQVTFQKDNRLDLVIQSADFELVVTGFDERRDLRVRVKPIEVPA